jgi:hypothetical protein
MCPLDELVNVQRTFDYRTETAMKEIYNQMMAATPNVRRNIYKEYSLHPIEVNKFILTCDSNYLFIFDKFSYIFQ